MLKQAFFLVVVTLIPALELRASIPYGIFGSERWGITPGLMSWPVVVLICIVANIALGWAVFLLLGPMLHVFERFALFRRVVQPCLVHAQARLKPWVDRHGELGVALFIGVPLPGSGVYTGAVGAFLLGLDRRKFFVACAVGVIIAAIAVTILALLAQQGADMPWFRWILKK